MGLGHMGPVCEQQVYVAANPKTRPPRTLHCEDPPDLPSVKGTPFTDGRTGGGPQEMAFVLAAAGLVPAYTQGRAGPGRPPHHEPASGQRAPPLIIRPGSQGSWARVRGTGSPPCTPEDRAFSRGPYFSAGLPPPQRQSAQGRPGDLGPRRGSGYSATPGRHGLGGRDTRPWKGSLLGTQACARLGG